MTINDELRRFCLSVIKQTYGYGYDPHWHADLTALGTDDDVYAAAAGGDWQVIRRSGRIVACGGLRSLQSHAASAARFQDRYADTAVGALWRVYVHPRHQGQGLGAAVVARLEAAARTHGYDLLYLHTSDRNPAAVRFWQARGFKMFLREHSDDRTVHMEKSLS